MRKFLFTICLMALCAKLFACSKQQDESYFPLAVGLQWEYAEDVDGEVTLINRIDGKETIDGKEYYKGLIFKPEYSTTRPLRDYYCRTTSKGFFFLQKSVPEKLFYPFPLFVGKSWTINHGSKKAEYKVEAIETVTIGNQKYENCFKISLKVADTSAPASTYYKYLYRAPGIGQIKSVGAYEINGENYPSESFLKNFKKAHIDRGTDYQQN